MTEAKENVEPARTVGAAPTAVELPAAGEAAVTARTPEEATARLVCLGGGDHEPLAGISISVADRIVCGPSRGDGVLEFVREKGQAFTVWGRGRVPVHVRSFEPTPAIVLLEEAAARIEVRLLDLEPGVEVVRTLLQPHAFQVTGEASWEPVLAPAGRDRLAGQDLPPGTYDVYVWVARPSDAPRCLSAAGVEVRGPEPVILELDAGASPDPEPDG